MEYIDYNNLIPGEIYTGEYKEIKDFIFRSNGKVYYKTRISGGRYAENSSFSTYKIREATQKEKDHLIACEEAGEFIPLGNINLNNYEIY